MAQTKRNAGANFLRIKNECLIALKKTL